jgi:hypothetical protein
VTLVWSSAWGDRPSRRLRVAFKPAAETSALSARRHVRALRHDADNDGSSENLTPDSDSPEMQALLLALAASRAALKGGTDAGSLGGVHVAEGSEADTVRAVGEQDAPIEFALDEEPIRPYQAVPRRDPTSDRIAHRLGIMAGLAIPLLAAAGFAAAYLHTSDPAPTIAGETSQAPTRAVARGDAVAPAFPEAAPISLLKSDVDYSQTFSRLFTDPAAFCQALDFAGLKATQWQRSQWDAATWECSSTLDTQLGDEEGSGSQDRFFFIVRGVGAERITSLRVKMRLADGDLAAAGKVRQFLGVLADFKDLAIPSIVTDAVLERRPAVLATVAGTFRFQPEKGDPGNFNLIVSYIPSAAGVMRTAPEALSREGIDDAG